MRLPSALATLLILLCCAAPIATQGHQSQEGEDQWKRFERKGGRLTKAETKWHPNGELSSANITEGRDLSLYDQGGYFNCFAHIPVRTQKEQDQIERRVRQRVATARLFILNHWQEHRRGYIRLSFDSVDAHSTSHIFIEPDSSGKWQVIWRIARDSNEITTLPVLRSVARDFSENESGELVFMDNDGDEWKRL